MIIFFVQDIQCTPQLSDWLKKTTDPVYVSVYTKVLPESTNGRPLQHVGVPGRRGGLPVMRHDPRLSGRQRSAVWRDPGA